MKAPAGEQIGYWCARQHRDAGGSKRRRQAQLNRLRDGLLNEVGKQIGRGDVQRQSNQWQQEEQQHGHACQRQRNSSPERQPAR